MTRTLALAMLTLLAATSLSHAQFVDLHASRGGVDGTFTLNYHGALADGTICPPADNGSKLSMTGPLTSGATTIRSVGLMESAEAQFGAAFTIGSFCTIRFDGFAVLAIHHGTSATLEPRKVLDRRPHNDDLLDITTLSGRYEMGYAPIICRVAPCPSGYYLAQDGQVIARADAVVVEDLAQYPNTVTPYTDAHLPFDWAFGTIRLPGPLGSTGADASHFPAFTIAASQFGVTD